MKFSFSDDTPKQNPWEDDRLGYAPFARRLAQKILEMSAPNGYVIGLHGAWGSGKSTAIQFVRAFVKKYLDENAPVCPLLIVEFRPWMISGHADLVSAFFKVLSEALIPTNVSQRRRKGKGVARWAKSALGPVVDATAKVAVVSSPIAGVGTALLKTSFGAALDKWLEEPSLQSAYDELVERLRAVNKNILVIIDDIDRLTGDEIRSIMQMVKTVGSLPNVIYLLAYDREIISAALSALGDQSRPGFVEKIVQHELELPKPPEGALLKLLNDELSFLPISERHDMRRYELIIAGIQRWIAYPRDVGRIANAIKFVWPSLQGEIDPFDLLCVECLRLFDPKLFAWISDNREFLVGDSMKYEFGDEQSALISLLKENLPAKTRADQLKVLCALFPAKAKAIEPNDGLGSELWKVTQLRRGIGFRPSYDAYFSLYPRPDAVPAVLLDTAIASLDDQGRQVGILRQLIKERAHASQLMKQYLVELRYRLFENAKPTAPSRALLNAIFIVGDDIQEISKDHRGFLDFPPLADAIALITAMFDAWQQEATGNALLEAFSEPSSVSFCAMVFVDIGRELGILSSDDTKAAERISVDDFGLLGSRMLSLIRSNFATGALDNAPYYFDIARAWAYLATSEEPKNWLTSGATSSPNFLAKVAYGLLRHSTSSEGSYWEMGKQTFEPYYDCQALYDACNRQANSPNLSLDESGRVKALRDGLARLIARA